MCFPCNLLSCDESISITLFFSRHDFISIFNMIEMFNTFSKGYCKESEEDYRKAEGSVEAALLEVGQACLL